MNFIKLVFSEKKKNKRTFVVLLLTITAKIYEKKKQLASYQRSATYRIG